ncbi:MAG: DUF4886 domain-containing protein [Clostridia bacterium]|nr:DUF4886 domain-containing protein [Clostridia bacterium]
MKRILAFVLVVLMLLPFASACGQSELKIEETVAAETETEAETAEEVEVSETETVAMTPQSPYEQSITRILILGSSSSNDVFFQLGRVFKAQGFGGKKYTLGFLYYSGCEFSEHVEFLSMNKPVYDYYKTSGEAYVREEESTMKHALADEAWDVIILHPGSADLKSEDLNLSFRRKIEAFVNEHVPTVHEFGFHLRCPNPNDPEIWGEDWPVQPPKGYRERLEEQFNFDPAVQYAKNLAVVQKNILTDPTYVHNVCTGAGMYYAQEVLGIAQTALYRDYTHLSDLGRVLAAYCFYVQFTGEAIDEVKLDRIPAKARQSRYQALGDLVLTEDLKYTIKEAANYSLEHPWEPIAK